MSDHATGLTALEAYSETVAITAGAMQALMNRYILAKSKMKSTLKTRCGVSFRKEIVKRGP